MKRRRKYPRKEYAKLTKAQRLERPLSALTKSGQAYRVMRAQGLCSLCGDPLVVRSDGKLASGCLFHLDQRRDWERANRSRRKPPRIIPRP